MVTQNRGNIDKNQFLKPGNWFLSLIFAEL